jgi:hypothetical protein
MRVLWLSPTGSDITGNGSKEYPYKTIDYALTLFTSGDQIRLLEGDYTPLSPVVFSNIEGSLFSDYPLGASIQPQTALPGEASISVRNSTRFTVQGVKVLQSADNNTNTGIEALNSLNFKCMTCEVSGFDVVSGGVSGSVASSSYGIYAIGTGRVENCKVYDINNSGDIGGIFTDGLHVIDCETYSLSGNGQTEGIHSSNAYNFNVGTNDPNSNFYVNNDSVTFENTIFIRGNTVSDCYGDSVIGIYATYHDTLRLKNNKTLRLRSINKNATGFNLSAIRNALLVYNVASRCNRGFYFTNISELNVYNLTSHNCLTHIESDVAGYFYNLSLSAYPDSTYWNNCYGIKANAAIYADYIMYYGLGSLVDPTGTGIVTQGSNISLEHILYFDEQNDNLLSDYISPTVKSGVTNPLGDATPDISGIKGVVTNEYSVDRVYQYDLIDNSFWNVEDDYAVEMCFIKAFQSRILGNSETATTQVVSDYYLKTANSTLAFSELYPTHAYYNNASKFKKQVMGLWYSGQNVGVTSSYSVSIGGYNLLPTFINRLESFDGCWVINESYIDVDNYLLGDEGERHGIGLDVLGVSTMSSGASAECYTNVMESVADIGDVRWVLHDEVQPETYVMFTDMYNGWEDCTLDNMIYNDDFAIITDSIGASGQIITPLISTEGLSISGGPSGSVSGYVELSTLDKLFSETVQRDMYYRVGPNINNMTGWSVIERPIGEILYNENEPYIQFRLDIFDVKRQMDYEFVGLCIRPANFTDPTDITIVKIAYAEAFYIP